MTILAHDGVNMLGGRDFDKSILNSVIRPWLLDKFDLSDDFQKAKSFQRLIRLAQLKGEQAKIELADHDYLTVERAIGELEAITIEILNHQPAFILGHFEFVSKQRHLASDASLHDQLVNRGIQHAQAGDIDALRGTIFEMYKNRAVPEVPTHNLAALAGLMTH